MQLSQTFPRKGKTLVHLWDGIFEQEPDYKRLWYHISDRDDWRDSEVSKEHSMIAGSFFTRMIDDFAGYTPKIIKVGYRHTLYKVGNKEIDPVFTNAFYHLATIVMGDKFTPPVKQSWTVAVKLMYFLMSTGAKYHH